MTFVVIILSYLFGCFPSGLVLGKLFYKKDIRQFGSGNLGATNTFRVLGKKAGFIVMFLDIFKGFIVVFFPLWFNVDIPSIFVGICAVIGHVFPIFLKFKGGKAVATSAGAVLGVHPVLLIVLAIVFIIILYSTKYVSLSSMIAGIGCVIGAIIIGDLPFLIVSIAIMLILLVRHQSNIVRIFKGNEPKIKWM
ncbi:MAG TPA: acyl-phosphate glycerol 3-phosphate acyltransferase [Staphylococcus sp.]|uniref:Glycerol-3-phosphate acyltransferase n=2 Tax=Staphylococcaceae TaxID=90964 RepID=A0A2T4PR47_9STAP|nr:glycerol-3-phosphate 1-O-acyltransferase PlsY [Mammaliicoccus sp. F-M27]PNZ40349.1 acyl-phosphate glycerol 3-phosphate acyltransferase [Mammaliicoccus vitulinus]HAL08698.1 acyl-phosphate glycerol 3-phosphate acyltransferase [Staphylococcus sp.]PTI28503.1 acyl-phosphate glycerol 3-phosphate acyltransferase [Mammaliicoccus vitulinus]PTI37255.1 acyl-phosphate glycerol 3-phosphate acyltransferase [Mammaliicoccus vitulinus]PTI89319.1 acyl-phosphate glycerol 3-phosphate acyltransferase [Mammaliic